MNWKEKLTSRKLWAAIAGVVVGLVVAFGGDPENIETIAGSVMSVVTAIAYILAEASVDKAAALPTLTVDAAEDEEKKIGF